MDNAFGFGIGSFFAWLVIIGVCGCLYGCPQYNVWSSKLAGEAELAQQTYSKQVAVQAAQAKLDSAKLLAQTDVVRAGGVAQANKIISDSLGGPEGYLRWKYIEMLNDTAGDASRSVIYVPTEATMPILEAGKRKE